MMGLRARMQMHDAAEQERQASLARWSDNELLMMFDQEARREPGASAWTWTLRLLAALALVVVFGGFA